MKRLLAVLLSVMMLLSTLSCYTFAAGMRDLLFEVSSNGENEIYVNAGDEITVDFTVTNISGSESFTITNLQNEIEFDPDFFEFTEGDVELITATSSRLADNYTWGAKRVQILALHVSGGKAKEYANSQLVARVTFKVKDGLANGTSGKLVNMVCEAADAINYGNNAYPVTSKGMTVYIGAEQQEEKYTVTYKDGNRVVNTDDSIIANSQISIYTSLSSAGKQFKGWKDENGKLWQPGNLYTVTKDMTFTAVWANRCVLNFETNGASSMRPVSGWNGDVIELAQYVPEKSGYTFEGWYSDSGLRNRVTSVTLTSNITVYAKWIKEAEYTLTFETNGGNTIPSVTKKSGTVVDLSAYVPKKTGYTFKGWHSDSALTHKVTSVTLINDMKVYAEWEKVNNTPPAAGSGEATKHYTVSFETDGGTVIVDVKDRENSVIDLSQYVPSKDGYKFEGWYSDKEFTNKVTHIKLTGNITLYANWTHAEDEKQESTAKPDILTDDHFAYIIGREDSMICPKDRITRAEAATVLFRLLKEEVRVKALTTVNLFSDVNKGDWFNTAVSTLSALEIVKGRKADIFAPDEPITRAELTTMVARLSIATYSGKAKFDDISGHWAENYINIAASVGWVMGDGNNLFRPNDNITRAEVMTLVNRVLGRVPESKDDLHKDMKKWSDNSDENAWYYLAVQEATNSHEYDKKQDGVHERWTKLVSDPDWKALEN